tara:strand:+ start:683 stop:934 length:252 start_codon:yes stop_codon:yes gene_type:complete
MKIPVFSTVLITNMVTAKIITGKTNQNRLKDCFRISCAEYVAKNQIDSKLIGRTANDIKFGTVFLGNTNMVMSMAPIKEGAIR